uniref:Uncharacterized protein n=1 Tax=Glossina pallidipes TaxID=7398 RepID=A0A1A9Z0H9_GLOPL
MRLLRAMFRINVRLVVYPTGVRWFLQETNLCEAKVTQDSEGFSRNQETAALHKRYLEGKSKRTAKKTEKKPTEAATTMLSGNLQSSVHVTRSSSGYETLIHK